MWIGSYKRVCLATQAHCDGKDEIGGAGIVRLIKYSEPPSLYELSIRNHMHDAEMQVIQTSRGDGGVFWHAGMATQMLEADRSVRNYLIAWEVSGYVCNFRQCP